MDVSKLKFRRFRPLRATAADRDRHAEVSLSAADFILPFFVVEGSGIDHPLPTLTGVSHLSVDRLVAAARGARAAGVGKVLLFGVVDPSQKAPDAGAFVLLGEVHRGLYDEAAGLGFEPRNLLIQSQTSSPLNERGMVRARGIEPLWNALEGRRSTNDPSPRY